MVSRYSVAVIMLGCMTFDTLGVAAGSRDGGPHGD